MDKLARVFPTVHPFEHKLMRNIEHSPANLQFFNKKATQALMSNSFCSMLLQLSVYYSGREQAGDKK